MNKMSFTAVLSLTAVFVLVPVVGTAAFAGDPLEDIRHCARMNDRDARIACFEALGERVLAEDRRAEAAAAGNTGATPPAPPASPPAVTAEPVAAPAATPEPVARAAEAPPPARAADDRAADAVESVNDRVTRCRMTADGSWYFYLASGEEWEQSNDRRYRFENCDFAVTISKGFFGFTMSTEDGRKVRVRRTH